MITRLKLKNWKSHLDSEFNFTDGVNALIGIMGSGKSSVTQAVCFALFGTFPALQSRRIGLDDLIMKKPSAKKHCEVELDIRVDGKDYAIKRVIEAGKGTTSAEILEDGKVLDETSQAVTRAVESIIQMDYELFARAVYSEQNGLDYFLRLPRGSRMQQIDKMLKVDRFETARLQTVAISNDVKRGREEKLRMVSDLEKEGLDEKAQILEKEISNINKERATIKVDLEAIQKQKSVAESGLSSIEAKENELNENKQELQGIRYASEEVKQSIEAKKKKLEEFGDTAAKSKQLDTEIQNLKKDLENVNSKVMTSRDQIASINTEIKLIGDSLKDLEAVKAKCPVCESDVSEEKKASLVSNRKTKENKLREKANTIATDVEKQSARKSELESEIRSKELELEKLKSVSGEAELLKELEARGQAYVKREQALSKKLEELETELAKIDLKELREKLREIAAKESEAATKLSGMNERLSDKQAILDDLKERKGIIERYKKEIEQDSDIYEKLGGFVKVLKMTQEQLRSEFLKTVNGFMESVWKELYPYGDFDSVRLTISEGDYVLQLKERSVGNEESWIWVDGIASGGERSMACLALRIAFSIAFIPNLKWLILDEPTHNLDANAIEQFSTILREKIDQFVDQVFIITHEERISESVGGTGSLYRLERDKEANEPTRIKTI